MHLRYFVHTRKAGITTPLVPMAVPCCITQHIEELFKEKNVANKVDSVKIKGVMTKWPVKTNTAQREPRTATRRNRHLK